MASLGKMAVAETLTEHAPQDLIKQLVGLSDQELMARTGMAKRLAAMKENLAEADTLTGKAREEFIEKLDERLTPRIDGYDLDWMVKDAKRVDKKSTIAEGPC